MGFLLWLVTAFASVGAGFLLYTSISDVDAPAPVQGAAAAVCVAIAVIPYVFARAWQEMAKALLPSAGSAEKTPRDLAEPKTTVSCPACRTVVAAEVRTCPKCKAAIGS